MTPYTNIRRCSRTRRTCGAFIFLIFLCLAKGKVHGGSKKNRKETHGPYADGAAFLRPLHSQGNHSFSFNRTIAPSRHNHKHTKSGALKNILLEKKIEYWLAHLDKFHDNTDPKIRGKLIQSYLREFTHNVENIPEQYFKSVVAFARSRGEPPPDVSAAGKKALSQEVIDSQKDVLSKWLKFMLEDERMLVQPMWAKVWAFDGLLKMGKYNREKDRFEKRDKKRAIAPFPELSRDVLVIAMNEIVKSQKKEESNYHNDPKHMEALKTKTFSQIYASLWRIHEATRFSMEETNGTWLTYKKGSNPDALIGDLKEKGTGWCTVYGNNAKKHLEAGDVHVYFSTDKQGKSTMPRLLIRFEEGRIIETIGIMIGEKLDAAIAKSGVLTTKLHELGEPGKRYEIVSKDMERLTSIEKQLKQDKELTTGDRNFIFQKNRKIIGLGGGVGPRVDEFRKALEAR